MNQSLDVRFNLSNSKQKDLKIELLTGSKEKHLRSCLVRIQYSSSQLLQRLSSHSVLPKKGAAVWQLSPLQRFNAESDSWEAVMVWIVFWPFVERRVTTLFWDSWWRKWLFIGEWVWRSWKRWWWGINETREEWNNQGKTQSKEQINGWLRRYEDGTPL